jgi:WD40 repeat protein
METHQIKDTITMSDNEDERRKRRRMSPPHLPALLVVDHVFPFLDRSTWNHLASASKEFRKLSRSLTHPWPQGMFAMDAAVYCVAFDPLKGQNIALSGAYGLLRLWNSKNGNLQPLEGHEGGVNAVSFSQDGHWLASAGDDRTVRVWNLLVQDVDVDSDDPPACMLTLKHPRSPQGHKVQCVQFSPSEATIASGSEDGRVRLWDLESGNLLRIFRVGAQRNSITCLSFSPDGQSIAFGGSDRTIRIKEHLHSDSRNMIEHNHCVNALAFSTDGKLFASGCRNEPTIQLYDTTTTTTTTQNNYQYLGQLHGHTHSITSLKFLDSSRLISASEDSSVRIWNVYTKECTFFQKSRARCLLSVDISPDKHFLAWSSITRKVCLWGL